MNSKRFNVMFLIMLFNCVCYLLLALPDEKGKSFDTKALIFGCIAMVAVTAFQLLCMKVIKNMDFAIIAVVSFLVSLGFAVQYRLDVANANKQVMWFVIGILFFFIAYGVIKNITGLEKYYIVYGIVSILLLIFTVLFAKAEYGAKNWIHIGPLSIQPSEIVKLTMILFMASTLNKKRNFLKMLMPLSIIGICMCIFVLQTDLGSALLLFFVTISMIFISTSNVLYVFSGLGMASAGAYLAYKLFSHVRVRVAAWQNPWADPTDKGYQTVQSLFAISAGGWFGTGIKLGHPYLIPIVESDFIFSAICEEFGVIMGLLVILMLLIIAYRGLKIAREAEDIFTGLLAAGCSLNLAYQTFVIVGGVIKFIPLTGVTLPFISYGGSSMLVNMMFIGILEAIHSNVISE